MNASAPDQQTQVTAPHHRLRPNLVLSQGISLIKSRV